MPRYPPPPPQCKHCAAQVARSNTYLLGSAGNADARTVAHTAPTRARTLHPTRARRAQYVHSAGNLTHARTRTTLDRTRNARAHTHTHTHRVHHIQTKPRATRNSPAAPPQRRAEQSRPRHTLRTTLTQASTPRTYGHTALLSVTPPAAALPTRAAARRRRRRARCGGAAGSRCTPRAPSRRASPPSAASAEQRASGLRACASTSAARRGPWATRGSSSGGQRPRVRLLHPVRPSMQMTATL